MPRKKQTKLSKKALKEKYPVKKNLDEEVAKFAGKVFLVLGLFVLVALSVDIYHFTH